MKPERILSCARALVLIEPYVDDDLSTARRHSLEQHLGACAACRDELADARSIRAELQALPRLACPDQVTDFVLGRVATSSPRGAWARLRAAVAQASAGPAWRPALAAAGVTVVALVITLLGQQPRQNGYTPQDLARAEVEARWALALVAQVTTRASEAAVGYVFGGVVYDVMGDQVFVPITDAVQKPMFNPPEEKETPE